MVGERQEHTCRPNFCVAKGECDAANIPATMSGKFIVYVDLLSQPCRAVHWFGLIAKVPNLELKLIQISKMQQLTPEYAKVYVG
jgi:hypothetical protein